MPLVSVETRSLKISFGPNAAEPFEPGLPVIAGLETEDIFGDAQPAGQAGVLTLFRTEGWLLGAASVPLNTTLNSATHGLYREIFEASAGWFLARICNYVPAINQLGPTGLENYQSFCQGRSLAFEEHYGSRFSALLPSASAVGTKSSALTVAFAACPTPPRHVENPLQLPAYHYPSEYGPRAPSFARATIVPGTERDMVFISGTAAIRGHATVAPKKLLPQVECTLENLREISMTCGLGRDLGRDRDRIRHFKVYVRNMEDQPTIASLLEEKFFLPTDQVSYLHADICRSQLQLEIEATLSLSPHQSGPKNQPSQ